MASRSKILIAMPLFEGWEYVAQTLDSIQAQTYDNFRVLISVDGDDRRSYAACTRYTADPRFELVLQPERIRWEGNINWLAGQLSEEYFCYWQHDDYCDSSYLEKLVTHADTHPEASAVYCDMKCFGTRDFVVQYPSVTGFALERVLKQAANNNPAPIRCLIRASAMQAALPIKLATTWVIALASAGELHRVPEVLYFRRLRPNSEAEQILARTVPELWDASLEWGLGVLQFALPLVQDHERDRLFAMVVDQLVHRNIRSKWQFDFETADQNLRVKFVGDLLREARGRFGATPYAEVLGSDDPRTGLEARKRAVGKFAGEELLLEASLAELPTSTVTRGKRSPRVTLCAGVVVRNEALFLRESLLSIKDCFDEIIVVDHGSVDETLDILEDLKPTLPEMRVYVTQGRESYANCRNLVAEQTKCDWIAKWDADFVAYESETPRGINSFRERLDDFSAAGVNLALLHAPNCGPTLETTLKGREVAGGKGDLKVSRREFSRHRTGRYADEYAVDAAKLRRVYLNRPGDPAFLVHLDKLKLPERLLIRDLMFTHDKERFSGTTQLSFDAWLKQRRVSATFQTMVESLLRRLEAKVVPFEFERWGPLPKLLTDAAKKQPFDLVSVGSRTILTESGISASFPRLRRWLEPLLGV